MPSSQLGGGGYDFFIIMAKKKKKRKLIDWEKIEVEYRAGMKSVRDIATQHGISHTAVNKKAKHKGWMRDLSKKIREKVSNKLVSTKVSTPNASAEEIIEAEATQGFEIRVSQRKDIGQARTAYNTLVGQLNELSQEREALEAEIIKETAGDKKLHRRNKMMKAISLPSHTGVLRDLSVVLKNLVPLERQAYNLDEPGVTLNDILNALPLEFRQAVRTELGRLV